MSPSGRHGVSLAWLDVLRDTVNGALADAVANALSEGGYRCRFCGPTDGRGGGGPARLVPPCYHRHQAT